jgi:hypothetical protein
MKHQHGSLAQLHCVTSNVDGKKNISPNVVWRYVAIMEKILINIIKKKLSVVLSYVITVRNSVTGADLVSN